eukprot:Lankesteria_metandrocarpae@DN3209_c0_g1_i2.p1
MMDSPLAPLTNVALPPMFTGGIHITGNKQSTGTTTPRQSVPAVPVSSTSGITDPKSLDAIFRAATNLSMSTPLQQQIAVPHNITAPPPPPPPLVISPVNSGLPGMEVFGTPLNPTISGFSSGADFGALDELFGGNMKSHRSTGGTTGGTTINKGPLDNFFSDSSSSDDWDGALINVEDRGGNITKPLEGLDESRWQSGNHSELFASETARIRKKKMRLSFEDICDALAHHGLYNVDKKRYFVLLSLDEAEGVRAAMHVMQSRGSFSLIPDAHVAVALRNLHARFYPLDCTAHFKLRSQRAAILLGYQQQSAHSICRFINSDAEYSERQISILLRALQQNECKARETWFFDLRKCRRRRLNVKWNEASVQKLFTNSNDLSIVQFRIVGTLLRRKLRAMGMSVSDGFRNFDTERLGRVSVAQMFKGFKWVGLNLTAQEMKDVAAYLCGDSTQHGTITEVQFLKAFSDPQETSTIGTTYDPSAPVKLSDGEDSDDDSDDNSLMKSGLGISPHRLTTGVTGPQSVEVTEEERRVLGHSENKSEVGPSMYMKLKCKLQTHTAFRKIWEGDLPLPARTVRTETSAITMSVWAPTMLEGRHRGVMRHNRHRVSLGCFMCIGPDIQKYAGNKSDSFVPLLYEFMDPKASTMYESPDLPVVLDFVLPHPSRFKLLWRDKGISQNAETPLFIWTAVPPTDHFVAIGVWATNSDRAPNVDCMRCVPRKWLRSSPVPPKTLWQDEKQRAANQHESIGFWVTTAMHMLGVSIGGVSHQMIMPSSGVLRLPTAANSSRGDFLNWDELPMTAFRMVPDDGRDEYTMERQRSRKHLSDGMDILDMDSAKPVLDAEARKLPRIILKSSTSRVFGF